MDDLDDTGEQIYSDSHSELPSAFHYSSLKRFLFPGITTLLLMAGLVTGTYLVQQSQDIRKKAVGVPLAEVENAIGGTILYSGNNNNLNIDRVQTGVYQIVAKSFPCTPGVDGCEPDRYEILFSKIIDPMYGLGMQPAVNQVEVSDILDKSFSFGHCYAEREDGKIMESYEDGACRQRTPMLFLPEKNLIIAYMQPEVKMLRITRNGIHGCPSGNTCLVMKKHHKYPEGNPAELVFIKGSSISDTYKKYYTYLKNTKNRFFKKPHFNAFGVNWETYFELGCDPTKSEIETILGKFESQGIKLSSLTIGSGYWNTETATGCGDAADSRKAQIDVLSASKTRFNGKTGLNTLFNNLMSKDIYPLIGMRHRVQPEYTDNIDEDNINRVWNFFKNLGYIKNYIISNNPSDINTRVKVYQRNKDNISYLYHYLLNTFDNTNTDTWINLLQNAYGNFKGIKHDDMDIHDQRGYYDWIKIQDPSAILENPTMNLRDDVIVPIFTRYNNTYGGDVLLSSDSDWFSLGTDWEEMDTLLMQRSWGNPPNSYRGYFNKFYVDLALTRVISGYVNTANHGNVVLNDINNIGYWYPPETNITAPSKVNEVIRTFQLITFHPASRYSTGYWRIKNPNGSDNSKKQSVMIWYMQLRERLRQYAYDNARRWYATGVPLSMQPLFFNWSGDPEVYKQYEYLYDSTDANSPRNEFMFGNALLVRPVFSNSNNVKVYFPSGRWKAFIGSASTKGVVYTKGYSTYPLPNLDSLNEPLNDYPIFLRQGHILLIKDADPNSEDLWAYVILDTASESSTYYHYPKDNNSPIQLQAYKQNSTVYIKNLNSGEQVSSTTDPYGKGFYVAKINSLLDGVIATPTPSLTPTLTPTTIPPTPTPTKRPPTPTPSQPEVPGDADGDGRVDRVDYNIWQNHYSQSTSNGPRDGDFNQNGKVEGRDYIIWLNNYGKW